MNPGNVPKADSRQRRRLSRAASGQRRSTQVEECHRRHRRALARAERARRTRISRAAAWPTARTATAPCQGQACRSVGGGNSGVEAAIDLPASSATVTLLEFGDTLRADAVLQKKLYSLQRHRHQGAQTTTITARRQGQRSRIHRPHTGQNQHVALEGVFIQIGLLRIPTGSKAPSSCRASAKSWSMPRDRPTVPGVFGAGDCNHGAVQADRHCDDEGAKASLAAFDHLIRS